MRVSTFFLFFSFSLLAQFVSEPLFVVDETTEVARLGISKEVTVALVDDPLGIHGKVLRTEWPRWGDGAPQWPAIKVPATLFRTKNWEGGWDAVRITVLNPRADVVDFRFCALGKPKLKFNGSRLLQPNVWNQILFPLEAIQKAGPISAITSFDLYMTRPSRAETLYVKKVELLKFADLTMGKFPLRRPFGDFESESALELWNCNGIAAELTAEHVEMGKQSVRLTFPAHREGNPPWPSFQAWFSRGTMPEDWSLYDRLQAKIFNPGKETILKYCLRDDKNKKRSGIIPLDAQTTTTFSLPVKTCGVDFRKIRQLDFFLTRPEKELTVFVDAVELVAEPLKTIEATLADIAVFREKLAEFPMELKKTYLAGLVKYEAALRSFAARFGQKSVDQQTFASFNKLTAEVSGWLAANRRKQVADAARLACGKRVPGARFGVAVADSMTKVMIRERPLDGVMVRDNVHLELAQNEYESVQIVVLGTQEILENVTVKVGELRGPQGILPASAVEVALVGHVLTKQPPYPSPYLGWWPDPILDFQQMATVKPDEAVSFWIRCHCPADARPGLYSGTLTVGADNAPAIPLRFTVRVFDFKVPTGSLLPTATDFRNHIRQVYGKGLPAAEYEKKVGQFRDLFARYKIDLDRIYRRPPAGHPEKLDLYLDDLKILRDRGELKAFNIFYFGTRREITDVDAPEVRKAIDNALATLRYWTPILKREGLLKYAYVYGYDEVPPACFPVIAKICRAIKEEFPDIPLMTTAYDHSFGEDTVLGRDMDIFVPLTPRFDPEQVARARAAGRDVWWYICIGPKAPYANWFVEHDAIEARLLMGMMAAKYRPGGFLYYALTRWPKNRAPIKSGPYTDWDPASYKTANGDGSIFCAGPDGPIGTIRSENFRDGIEDYAYYRILEAEIAKAKARANPGNELRRAIETAEAGLPVDEKIVTTMKEFSRDPLALRAERRRVAKLIIMLKSLK